MLAELYQAVGATIQQSLDPEQISRNDPYKERYVINGELVVIDKLTPNISESFATVDEMCEFSVDWLNTNESESPYAMVDHKGVKLFLDAKGMRRHSVSCSLFRNPLVSRLLDGRFSGNCHREFVERIDDVSDDVEWSVEDFDKIIRTVKFTSGQTSESAHHEMSDSLGRSAHAEASFEQDLPEDITATCLLLPNDFPELSVDIALKIRVDAENELITMKWNVTERDRICRLIAKTVNEHVTTNYGPRIRSYCG